MDWKDALAIWCWPNVLHRSCVYGLKCHLIIAPLTDHWARITEYPCSDMKLQNTPRFNQKQITPQSHEALGLHRCWGVFHQGNFHMATAYQSTSLGVSQTSQSLSVALVKSLSFDDSLSRRTGFVKGLSVLTLVLHVQRLTILPLDRKSYIMHAPRCFIFKLKLSGKERVRHTFFLHQSLR